LYITPHQHTVKLPAWRKTTLTQVSVVEGHAVPDVGVHPEPEGTEEALRTVADSNVADPVSPQETELGTMLIRS
jgi:hypothetical protein